MPRHALRSSSALLIITGALLSGAAQAAHADPVSGLRAGGAPYAVFVVKDLGGGAYYNVTTGSLYAVQAGSDAIVGAAGTTSGLLLATAQLGSDSLLLVNGKVLIPLTAALP